MKLRIKGNTLRLRLNQSELSTFANTGMVSSKISFSQKSLQYALISADKPDISVLFSDDNIEVYIPHSLSRKWTDTDMVSLNCTIKHENGEELDILVEKDYQCLHKRPGEDENDNFPNPLAETKLR